MIFPFDSTFFSLCDEICRVIVSAVKHQLMSLKAIDEDEEYKMTEVYALAVKMSCF